MEIVDSLQDIALFAEYGARVFEAMGFLGLAASACMVCSLDMQVACFLAKMGGGMPE